MPFTGGCSCSSQGSVPFRTTHTEVSCEDSRSTFDVQGKPVPERSSMQGCSSGKSRQHAEPVSQQACMVNSYIKAAGWLTHHALAVQMGAKLCAPLMSLASIAGGVRYSTLETKELSLVDLSGSSSPLSEDLPCRIGPILRCFVLCDVHTAITTEYSF